MAALDRDQPPTGPPPATPTRTERALERIADALERPHVEPLVLIVPANSDPATLRDAGKLIADEFRRTRNEPTPGQEQGPDA